MALATAAITAGTTAAFAYLDAKLGLRDDLKQQKRRRKALKSLEQVAQEDRVSLWYVFADSVARHPDHRCIWSRERCYSWQETLEASARYAQYLLAHGVRPGDIVAMCFHNSPDFIFVWMALWSIGCAPAFINHYLTGDAILHSLKVSNAKLALVDVTENSTSRFEETRAAIEDGLGMTVIILDHEIKNRIQQLPAIVPPDTYRKGIKASSPAILFYTSGTTGNPKAVQFPISQLRMNADHLEPVFDCKGGPGGDTWYISIPLFHGSGGMNAYGCLASGMGIAISEKFSVSNFWREVRESDSTVILYVGETARYLLNAPPSPADRDHRVRLMHGNGLRPDVWERFRERFNVPEIAEFFSATEGNIFLRNHNKGPWSAHAVGKNGFLIRRQQHDIWIPVAIDHDSGDIYRDPQTGFAKRVPYSEGGEIIVPLPNEQAWKGYFNDPSSTQKKLIRNVFCQGDLYYRTGDALRRSDDGLWYFMDKLGDGFRWKSENVSTAQVTEVLGKYPGIHEAVVYGVLVPNHDGRAGCAAVLLDSNVKSSFDFNALLEHMRSHLPPYAVPVFIRLISKTMITANNKHNKGPLKTEGIDLETFGSKVSEGTNDRMLWIPPRANRYVDFSREDLESLKQGKARL